MRLFTTEMTVSKAELSQRCDMRIVSTWTSYDWAARAASSGRNSKSSLRSCQKERGRGRGRERGSWQLDYARSERNGTTDTPDPHGTTVTGTVFDLKPPQRSNCGQWLVKDKDCSFHYLHKTSLYSCKILNSRFSAIALCNFAALHKFVA